MKNQMVSTLNIYFVFVLTSILLFTIALAQDKQVTITGVVEAIDWDSDDNVIEVAIVVSEDTGELDEDGEPIIIDENYYVTMDTKGKELIKYVDKKVQVTGILKIDEDEDTKTITVKNYKVIEDK